MAEEIAKPNLLRFQNCLSVMIDPTDWPVSPLQTNGFYDCRIKHNASSKPCICKSNKSAPKADCVQHIPRAVSYPPPTN